MLKENDLPDIRFHDLRHTYSPLLIMNDYDLKAVSKLMGHAHSIITVDVYIDKTKLAVDCLEGLEPFIASVKSKLENAKNNYTNLEKMVNTNDYIDL